MSGAWFVDIETAAGVKVGSGPIASANRWTHTKRLDRAGTIGMQVPAVDPITAEIIARRLLRCRGVRNNALVDFGAGFVESLTTDPEGRTLDVSGSDLLIELANTSVHFLKLDNSPTDAAAPMPAASVLGAIMAFAP